MDAQSRQQLPEQPIRRQRQHLNAQCRWQQRRIPGYRLFSTRAGYDFGPRLSDLNVAVGVKNTFNQQYFTRSFDNNKGKYVGEPRTLYVRTSVAF